MKTLHQLAVALTFLSFFVRGLWMIRGSPLLRARLTRILPHLIDTVLLVSGIALMLAVRQYPGVHGWLTAKILGLLIYIGLGLVAFRFGRTQRTRTLAWLAALLTFGYIVAVALTRDPLPLALLHRF